MDARERVHEQIAHHETDFVPYVLDMFDEVAEALDTCYGSPQWRVKIDNHIRQVAIIPLPWEPAGEDGRGIYGTVWRTDLRPAHLQSPALSEPSLAGFRFPAPEKTLVDQWRGKVIAARERYPDHFLITGFGNGIWEACWYLRGMENALADAALEPKFFEEMTCAITEHRLEVLELVADLPVDGLMLGDDWGHQRGLFIGPERWRRFLKPNLRRVYDRIHAAGKVTLTHCCGRIVDIMPDLIEIGLDVLESVQPEAMDPYMLKREYGKDITFWGGLGSQSTLAFGAPAEIRAEVRRLCEVMSAGGGYVLGPAKPLRPEMPVKSAAATVEAFLEQAGVTF